MLDADSLALLRRALGSFRGPGAVEMFRDRFVRGCLDNGYDGAFAESCFRQLQGFFGYGFPENHAASFALLVYASAWLKRNHPEAFACALLNALPMGFYAPAQIVRDARKHGVDVRPVCIERSYWDHVLEPSADGGLAVRLGFRQIKASARRTGSGSPPPAATDTARSTRCGVGPASPGRTHSRSTDLAAGTRCGRSRGWCRASAAAVRADRRGPAGGPDPLPPMSAWQEVFEDHVSMRLSLQEHPVSLLAPALGRVIDAAEIRNTPDGVWVTVAGLVMTRQRPSTASEVVFITHEDQTTPASPASSGRRHSRSTSGKSWPGGYSASAAGSSAKGSSPTRSHQG